MQSPLDSRINAGTRARALQRLAHERFDVIVVGAGVTGAGVALDAASRGLSVAVVDARDAASGTSQWSSKMVHGGLRYLATGQVGIARESAVERHHLMTRIAPHLVRPRHNILPYLPTMTRQDVALTRTGLHLADGLRRAARTPSSLLPGPGVLGASEARRALPAWRAADIRGAATYWDGELEDDARLVTTLLRTAATFGAQVATYVRAHPLDETRLSLHDTLGGETFEADAGCIIAAPGVWAGEFSDGLRVVPSRGTHLVVEAARVGRPDAVITVPVPGERGRYVFCKPAPDDLVHIGLTDEHAPGASGWDPGVPEAEVDVLLAAMGPVLTEPLERCDLVGAFAGLRPLVEQVGKASADVSRDHVLLDEPGRPLVVTGGKLTTYRRMAQDAVDAAAARLQARGRRVGPCVTTRTPLVGAAAPGILRALPEAKRLVARYGTLAGEVDALIARDRALGTPAVEGSDVTRAELQYGITHEGAMTPEDVVARRARLTLREATRPEALSVAADLLHACA